MNVLSNIRGFLSGGKLVAQTGPLPYGDPLGGTSLKPRTLAIQERVLTFTGEDFDVTDAENDETFCSVRGAMLHLPGKDKMRIKSDGRVLATLDRKKRAMTPTYDVSRGEFGEKIGFIEQANITDTFEFHAEKTGGILKFRRVRGFLRSARKLISGNGVGPFKPPAAYKLEGDFLDRRFVMKNEKGEVVAKVTKDKLIEYYRFNHYQVQIAPGMDPILVVACACVIDEEFDEEHKERREQEN
jgi:uncharacterized protein YxjI